MSARTVENCTVANISPNSQPILEVADPCSDRARRLLCTYIEDVARRYYGRPLTQAERAAALADMPGDNLAEPRGVLLIARLDGKDVGCGGVRFLDGGIGEVTSLFVLEQVRRYGIGALLLTELETIATKRGLTALRLDTRHDLVEARRLYARHGFHEVNAFNDEPYAERWFAKALK
jgi:ribosomal protein S18 acetylase RimI-like enzyme